MTPYGQPPAPGYAPPAPGYAPPPPQGYALPPQGYAPPAANFPVNLHPGRNSVFDSQVTLEERRAIVAKVTEELISPTQLAQIHGISISAIRGWVKSAGKNLPSRYKTITERQATNPTSTNIGRQPLMNSGQMGSSLPPNGNQNNIIPSAGNSGQNFQNHVGKNFVCSTCGHASRTNHALNQHILKRHPQDPRGPFPGIPRTQNIHPQDPRGPYGTGNGIPRVVQNTHPQGISGMKSGPIGPVGPSITNGQNDMVSNGGRQQLICHQIKSWSSLSESPSTLG